jgi:type I restriction enzyme M protein
MARKATSKSADSTANLGFEAKLRLAADNLRNNRDAAEYKHVVLGLIFLKYISDTLEEHRAKLKRGKGDNAGATPEAPDEPSGARHTAAGSPKGERGGANQYKAENVFWVPAEARWSHLQAGAKQPTIGKTVDDAMVAIERDNPTLKGVLPKDYARPALDKHRLGELIDLIGTIALVSPSPQPSPSGRVGEKEELSSPSARRAGDEGRKLHYRGGYGFSGLVKRARELRKDQTPAEDLLWELLRDRQLCNAKFRRQHQLGDYLCDFYCYDTNLVVECDGEPHHTARGKHHDAKRDSYLKSQGQTVLHFENDRVLNDTDTFRRDLHPDLRADYVLANPPFNDSDWLRKDDDIRWQYGFPPKGNANSAWVQHFIHHLAPQGIAGFVLANGSMYSNQSGEGTFESAFGMKTSSLSQRATA